MPFSTKLNFFAVHFPFWVLLLVMMKNHNKPPIARTEFSLLHFRCAAYMLKYGMCQHQHTAMPHIPNCKFHEHKQQQLSNNAAEIVDKKKKSKC